LHEVSLTRINSTTDLPAETGLVTRVLQPQRGTELTQDHI